jgi:hypothetical protein
LRNRFYAGVRGRVRLVCGGWEHKKRKSQGVRDGGVRRVAVMKTAGREHMAAWWDVTGQVISSMMFEV